MTVRMICDIRSRFVQAMKQAGIKASKLTFKNLILACQQAGLQDQALNIKVILMSAILDHNNGASKATSAMQGPKHRSENHQFGTLLECNQVTHGLF